MCSGSLLYIRDCKISAGCTRSFHTDFKKEALSHEKNGFQIKKKIQRNKMYHKMRFTLSYFCKVCLHYNEISFFSIIKTNVA